MCGIACYAGKRPAKPFIIQALKRLEYRGYDSWGYTIFDDRGVEENVRSLGGPGEPSAGSFSGADYSKEPVGRIGLGHTRWATNGKVSIDNTHPVAGRPKPPFPGAEVMPLPSVYVVHNGVVENYQELREELEAVGHTFDTETDTEVIAHLLADMVPTGSGNDVTDLADAVIKVMKRLKGANAFVAGFVRNWSSRLVAASNGSPLVFTQEGHIASDPIAFAGFAKGYSRLPNGQVAIVSSFYYDEALTTRVEFVVPDTPGSPDAGFYRPNFKLNVPAEDATQKGPYEHFMRKEIFEQEKVLEATVLPKYLPPKDRVCLFGCGSSYHAALVGRHYFEGLANLPTSVEYATELADRNMSAFGVADTLFVGLTQSGETKDTLAAFHKLRASGVSPLVITNNPDSTVAQCAYPMLLGCGVERGVAATKTFTAQLIRLYQLAAGYCFYRGLDTPDIDDQFGELRSAVSHVLTFENRIKDLAIFARGFRHHLYLARGILYPIAMEGALKVKEVAYIHAEAIHSSEMKHGPIALIDDNTLSIFLLTEHNPRVSSNIREILARRGKVLVFADNNMREIAHELVGDSMVVLPTINPYLQPIVMSVALQLFAYHIAVTSGLDVDRPRNLAKSVTVE